MSVYLLPLPLPHPEIILKVLIRIFIRRAGWGVKNPLLPPAFEFYAKNQFNL